MRSINVCASQCLIRINQGCLAVLMKFSWFDHRTALELAWTGADLPHHQVIIQGYESARNLYSG